MISEGDSGVFLPTVPHSPPWPEHPYRGLAYFGPDDAPLFTGRDGSVDRCTDLLTEARTRILLLHGQTGCGKSSFLRAGLIPRLESSSLAFQFLRKFKDDSDKVGTPIFVRCGADPVGRIAEALYIYSEHSARVQYVDSAEERDIRSIRMHETSIQSFVSLCRKKGKLLESLRILHSLLSVTILLVVDQGEEVISLAETSHDYRGQFFRFIQEFLSTNFPVKLLIALRKDYSGEFVELAQLGGSIPISYGEFGRDPLVLSDMKMFFLPELPKTELLRAITLPTSPDISDGYQTGREKYGFKYAPELAEKIADDLLKATTSALPVMQIVCKDLYERAQVSDKSRPCEIDKKLYETGGFLSGPVDRHIRNSLRASFYPRLSPELLDAEEQKARDILQSLVIETETSVHSNQVSLAQMHAVAKRVKLASDIDRMLDELSKDDVLLIRTFSIPSAPNPDERKMFSLGHDFIGGVLTQWKREREAERKAKERLKNTTIVVAICCTVSSLLALALFAIASYERDIGTQNTTLTMLERHAQKYERSNPVYAMSFAGQAMRLDANIHRLFWERMDKTPINYVAKIARGLPDILVSFKSADLPGRIRYSTPLKRTGRYLFLTDSNAVIMNQDGSQIPFVLPAPLGSDSGAFSQEDFVSAETDKGEILILRNAQQQQLYVLSTSGVVHGPFDSQYFANMYSIVLFYLHNFIYYSAI